MDAFSPDDEDLFTNIDGEEVPFDELSEAEQEYYRYVDAADDDDPGVHVSLAEYVRNWEASESGIDVED